MKNFFYKDIKICNINEEKILSILKKKNKKTFIFLNPFSIYNMGYDKNFQLAVKNSYNFIDGVGLQIILFIIYFKKIFRTTGFFFFEHIAKNFRKKSFFFLGSNFNTLVKIKKNLKDKYNIDKVNYYAPPFKNFFSKKDNLDIIRRINRCRPDFLFVGMTAPKQEIWVNKNINKINCRCVASVGLVFDYLAGNLLIPPKSLRIIGLEWLFRLVQRPKLIYRTLIAAPIFFIQFLLKKKYLKKNFYIIENNYNHILKKNKFIYAAFNLSFYSFNIKKNISKFVTLWPDGFFLKLLLRNQLKIPGWFLIKNLRIPNSIKKIKVIGNFSKRQKLLLSKYNLLIENLDLPVISEKDCQNMKIKVNKNELVLITLPSPKQEYLALSIARINRSYKIICIGGGLSIAAGDEKVAPFFLSEYGFEWLWRLRFETFRRIFRLSKTLYLLLRSFFLNKNYYINLKSDYNE